MAFGKKPRLTDEEIYQKIQEFYYSQGKDIDMKDLFEKEENRFQTLSSTLVTASDGTILVDYSKNLITTALLDKLLELAEVRGVEQARTSMFTGKKVNTVENQPVLHNALRKADFDTHRQGKTLMVDKFNIVNECEDLLEKMYEFVQAVHNGKLTGCKGRPFTDVVVIGQGGLVLASQMTTEALTPFNKGLKMHYVMNVDGSNIVEVLKKVTKCGVLFVIVSVHFKDETAVLNAHAAKNWFLTWSVEKSMENHFVAVTLNKPEATKFGILPKNVFRYGEYVGECYSIWSPIGLPVALSIGTNDFSKFLSGAKFMDDHFESAKMNENVPIILAMIGIWYINFFGSETQAILPYDQYLHLFPSYVQFLNMKSNGKCYLGQNLSIANFHTGPVTWGEAGTNGQHAFYQLLHQGTKCVPCDFIIPALSHNPIEDNKHHRILVANFLAQTEALMKGRDSEEVKDGLTNMTEDEKQEIFPHKVFEGNRPSNSIVVKQLTPFTLGALMALYEHKAFVQSIIWNIDPFVHAIDNFSAKISSQMLFCLEDWKNSCCFDQSTNRLISFFKWKIQDNSLKDLGMLTCRAIYDHPPIAEISKKCELFNLVALSTMIFFWYIYNNYK